MNLRNLFTTNHAKDAALLVMGGLLVLLGLHIWTDHASLHQIIGFINEHADQIKKLP